MDSFASDLLGAAYFVMGGGDLLSFGKWVVGDGGKIGVLLADAHLHVKALSALSFQMVRSACLGHFHNLIDPAP